MQISNLLLFRDVRQLGLARFIGVFSKLENLVHFLAYFDLLLEVLNLLFLALYLSPFAGLEQLLSPLLKLSQRLLSIYY